MQHVDDEITTPQAKRRATQAKCRAVHDSEKTQARHAEVPAARSSFSVVEGGRLRPVPRMLVVNVDNPSPEERTALAHARKWGLRVASFAALRPAERADQLARFCEDHDMALREVAVIALEPSDRELVLEAGTAFALKSAGYDACVAADHVFCEREHGGLVAAIQAVCDLVNAP